MDWHALFTAIAIVCVLEGILPFMSPNSVRRMYEAVCRMSDQSLRFIGLSSMMVGIIILYIIR